MTTTTSKLYALIITGGRDDFEREAFYEMFNSFVNIDYEEVMQPEANRKLTTPFYDAFDVLVFYDMVQDIRDQEQVAFIKALERKNMFKPGCTQNKKWVVVML